MSVVVPFEERVDRMRRGAVNGRRLAVAVPALIGALALIGGAGIGGIVAGTAGVGWIGGGAAEAAAPVELSEALAANPDLGVRFVGVGGAYSALLPDVPAGLVNPAGLTALRDGGAAFSVGIPLDADDTSVSLAYGAPDRGIGGTLLSWVHNPVLLEPSGASGDDEYLVKTRFAYAFGRRVRLGGVEGSGVEGSGVDDAAAGRSASALPVPPAESGGAGNGAAGRRLARDTLAYGLELHYDRLENERRGASASLWGVGLGVMYQYSERLRAAIHLPNAFQTPIRWSEGEPSQSVGRRPVLGLAFQADPATVLALDWAPESESLFGDLRGGVESWVREDFGLRLGGELSHGSGTRAWSAGLSWIPPSGSLRLDAGYAHRAKQLSVSASYAF